MPQPFKPAILNVFEWFWDFAGTPAEIAGASAKVAGTPAEIAETPINVAGASAKNAETPVNVAGASAKNAETPVNIAGASAKNAEALAPPHFNSAIITWASFSPHRWPIAIDSFITSGLVSTNFFPSGDS